MLCGAGFTLGVTLYADESCDGDGESLVSKVNILGAGINSMNVPERVYGIYVLTVRNPMVFSYKLY